MTVNREEDALALSETILDLQKKVKKLEEGARANRLGNSSFDLSGGRGYIPFFENGVEKARIGRMPDGTVTTASMNNPDPPSVPNLPVVIAGLGILTVGVEKLTGPKPYDFSHLRVYVDGLLDGTITRLPGLWVVSGIQVGTQHSIQISAVNLSGKESAKTASVMATPLGVTQRNFTTNPITRTEVTDAIISTPQLAANAVEANNIAANAIEAAKIKAGAVTADKLEAVMVLATRIIAGNLLSNHLEIYAGGIEQYDKFGGLTFSIGANPAGGNFLTIVDPNDTSTALASIDSEGVISASGFNLNGDLNFNGESLASIIDSMPRGLQAIGVCTQSPNYSTETGFLELAFDCVAGRAYKISTTPVYLSDDINYVNDGALRLRYTTNGARPTNASPLLIDCIGTNGPVNTIPAKLDYIFYGPTARVRLLFTMSPFGGKLINASPGIASGVQAFVEDIGAQVSITQGASIGGSGSAPAPVQTFTREFLCTASRSWNSAASPVLYQGNGGYGPGASFIGFDDIGIRAALAGAEILKIELYLYASHWWYSTGGTVVIGTHNRINADLGNGTTGGTIANYPDGGGGRPNWITSLNRTTYHLNKPEGRWQVLNLSILGDLQSNICKGLILDAGPFGNTKDYYGQFGNSATPLGQRPSLRITYRK